MQSENINELAAALAKAQAAMQPASKDAENPFFKSSYATLSSVWDACRKPLADNGLSVAQVTEIGEQGTVLITSLLHSSGQWVSGEMPIRPGKPDPQAFGSALTYARRYALASIVGVSVADEDDDGQAASKPPVKQQAKKRSEALPAKPNGNGNKPDPQTLFNEVQKRTNGYYKNVPHLYQALGAWPDFNDPAAVEGTIEQAVKYASKK